MDKKRTRYLTIILLATLIILGLALICGYHKPITPAALRDYIKGFGRLAAVVYVALYILNTIVLLPPIGILSLAAGLAFGKVWGAVLLMSGAVIGTSITFLISRFSGRSFVEKLMKDKFKSLDDLLEKKGFVTVLFFRVIPIVPYEALNYAGGLSKIKFWDYFFATFLGLIPGVIISAFFGGTLGEVKGLKDLISFKFILAAVVLAVFILIPVIYQYLKRKKDNYGK